MKLLDRLLGARQPRPTQSINELLQSLSKRAERLQPDQLVSTFVSLGGIEASLSNTDNRILFGRRGTGKTHMLAWVASVARKKKEIALQVDMRTIGSNSYIYSDPSMTLSDRATLLLRDFVQEVHQRLLEVITDPNASHRAERYGDLLDKLSGAVTEVIVKESIELTTVGNQRKESSTTGSSDLNLAANPSLSFGGSLSSLDESINSEQVRVVGKSRLSVNIGRVNSTLREIGARLGVRTWVLIDEWSALPEDLQPILADFLKRVFFPEPTFTVQIAAIEHRSRFRDDKVGIELGSDASADINFDDHLVFENDKAKSKKFFRDLLYQHLRAAGGDHATVGTDSSEFVSLTFTQETAFNELVRAAEGVPRDAINILQIAALRASENKISVPNIRSAAKDWYDRDKASFVNTNSDARALLSWIIDRVIGERKARAFLTRSDERQLTLDRLFDERILHIAKKSYSTKAEPGVRFRVWKIDYGCYVDLINTAQQPTEELFDSIGAATANAEIVPEDDLRAIRRAILDFKEYGSRRSED